MYVRTFACRNMNPHTGSAKQQRSFVISFGNFRPHTKTYAMKHQIRIIRVAILFYTEVKDFLKK